MKPKEKEVSMTEKERKSAIANKAVRTGWRRKALQHGWTPPEGDVLTDEETAWQLFGQQKISSNKK